MFALKRSIPRRTFLRGVGVGVALPLLDAMVPAFTAVAQTAAKPQLRVGFVYIPHGVIMREWTPAAAGTTFERRLASGRTARQG
jgi:ABC-type Na+ efflux pump permease subunit